MVNRVAFLGCGSWGAALSTLLVKKGVQIKFWHRDAKIIKDMTRTRSHYLLPSIKFPDSVLFYSNIDDAINDIDTIVIAVPSQHVRELISKVQNAIKNAACIINIAKGIENHTLMTMSEVINDVIGSEKKNCYFVWTKSR